jgi:hypothetical protein
VQGGELAGSAQEPNARLPLRHPFAVARRAQAGAEYR